MADPVREALRVAERAIARSLHAAGLPGALGEDQWTEEAAAAIAAFLRALDMDATGLIHDGDFCRNLAAAVEAAAAKEAQDG